MSTAKLILLLVIFFAASLFGVVTGSTSLITVPALISLGIEPHAAIATNMLALTIMSVGGSIPFVGKGVLPRGKRLHFLIVPTLIGSTLGALLLLTIPVHALQIVIAVVMIVVAAFTVQNRNLGAASHDLPTTRGTIFSGYIATFFLAIYGGFFSGGYVTMLTAVFVLLLGMSFLQAVASTKVINIFSSGVATIVFAWRGVVDMKLGIILGIAMFLGALLGGRLALKLSVIWLRRIFIVAVVALAVKMLLPL